MIEIINHTKFRIPRKKINQLCRQLYSCWQLPPKAELEIIFATPQEIKKINSQHRNKNKATDVLSFPLSKSNASQALELLGSIVLCPPIIKKQEGQYAYEKYIIHGFMHLMGYNHENKDEIESWDKIEQELINLTQ